MRENQQAEPPGLPLAGLTVMELGSSLAGPFCTRTLAGLGATVWKVEPPETGEPARHWGAERLAGETAAFQAINREKRSLTADFGRAEDIAMLHGLLSGPVDIVVQNLRPGVAEKFRLDAGTARALNPGLIYCNVTAFGRSGPMRERPGYDPLVQAFGGLIDITGDADGPPARVGVPIMDIGTGMWATIGVLSALAQRHRTGAGCVVDSSMLDAAMAWHLLAVAKVEGGGAAPKRSGLRGPLVVPNRGFATADGLLLITIGTDAQFARLCREIGAPELADDPRFASNNARADNEAALVDAIEARLGAEGRGYWAARFETAGIPNAPIQSLEEVMAHPQVIESGILQDSPDGRFRTTGVPLLFDGVRPGFRRLAPALGEGNAEIAATATTAAND